MGRLPAWLRRRLQPPFARFACPSKEPKRINQSGVLTALSDLPLRLRIGGHCLAIELDSGVAGPSPSSLPQVVVYPCEEDTGPLSPAYRIPLSGVLRINRSGTAVAHSPVLGEFLLLRYADDGVLVKDPGGRLDATLECPQDSSEQGYRSSRRAALLKVRELFGGPLEPLSPAKALASLQAVNRLMAHEAFRPLNTSGAPGGLLELPAGLTPILVGDLHARVDNLLRIISEAGVLPALERGDAALVLLGDVVHCEQPDRLKAMDDSLLMMDLIFRLKLAFPDRLFFLRGNHDSFSPSLLKQGVPQGALWRHRLTETRGEDYIRDMRIFYEALPLVAVSPGFAACHAGPPRKPVRRDDLVDVSKNPELAREIVWTRVRAPGNPAGYSRAHVRRFRNTLGLKDPAPLVVAHNPLSASDTLWLDAAGIPHHHVLYSARRHEVGALVGIKGRWIPMVLRAEPLTQWVNSVPADARDETG
ncbi:MAG: metallophosphoesterase [Pseudomonadota bacterium]